MNTAQSALGFVRPTTLHIDTFPDPVTPSSYPPPSSSAPYSPYPSFGSAATSWSAGTHYPDAERSTSTYNQYPAHYQNTASPSSTQPIPTPDSAHSHAHTHTQKRTPSPPIAQSPAALFLAAFSPSPASAPIRARAPRPDDEGQAVAGGYVLGPVIGHGGFSIIRKARSPDGAVVAVKIVRSADVERVDAGADEGEEEDEICGGGAKAQLNNELSLWAGLQHEHVLPLFSAQVTPYAAYMVTLFCPAGSLLDILRRDGTPALPHDTAGTLFRQVVRGLRYLHEQARVVHGDMKLENVLVDEVGACRISDFGLATKMRDASGATSNANTTTTEESDDAEHAKRTTSTRQRGTRTAAGVPSGANLTAHLSLAHRNRLRPTRHRTSSPFPSTPSHTGSSSHRHATPHFQPGSLPYAAPELLMPPDAKHAHEEDQGPNPAQDVWALGVLLYALLVGRLPFKDEFEPRLQMKIVHGAFDIPPTVGAGAERVLRGCLEKAVPRRWTIDVVDDAAWGVGAPAQHDLEHHHVHALAHLEEAQLHAAHAPGVSTGTGTPTGVDTVVTGGKASSRERTRPYPSHDVLAHAHPAAHPHALVHELHSGEGGVHTTGTSTPSHHVHAHSHAHAHAHEDDPFRLRGRRAQRVSVLTDSVSSTWTASPSPGPSLSHSVSTESSGTGSVSAVGSARRSRERRGGVYTARGGSASRSRSRSVPPRTPVSPASAAVLGVGAGVGGRGVKYEDVIDEDAAVSGGEEDSLERVQREHEHEHELERGRRGLGMGRLRLAM